MIGLCLQLQATIKVKLVRPVIGRITHSIHPRHPPHPTLYSRSSAPTPWPSFRCSKSTWTCGRRWWCPPRPTAHPLLPPPPRRPLPEEGEEEEEEEEEEETVLSPRLPRDQASTHIPLPPPRRPRPLPYPPPCLRRDGPSSRSSSRLLYMDRSPPTLPHHRQQAPPHLSPHRERRP